MICEIVKIVLLRNNTMREGVMKEPFCHIFLGKNKTFGNKWIKMLKDPFLYRRVLSTRTEPFCLKINHWWKLYRQLGSILGKLFYPY